MELLLESGANVNARAGLNGAEPGALWRAVAADQVGAVRLLLAAGATVQRDELLVAISQGRVEIASNLLAAGGDPRWVLPTGRTVLDEAQHSPPNRRHEMTAMVGRYLRPAAAPK